jgi:hypothetical protein
MSAFGFTPHPWVLVGCSSMTEHLMSYITVPAVLSCQAHFILRRMAAFADLPVESLRMYLPGILFLQVALP